MPDIPLPEDLSTYIRTLESRIRALETAPRAVNTSQPWQFASADATFTTSSLTYVDSSPAGPTLTLQLNNAGNVLITAGAYIGLNDVNQTAAVSLNVNGANYIDILALGSSSGTAFTIATNVSSTRVIALAAGIYTFKLQYKVTASSANFSARSLSIQPF